MPDAELIVADGCLSSDTLKNAGAAADGVWASSPDLSAFQGDEFYAGEFIPAYQAAFGSEPLSVFHAHAYDAANVVFDAIKEVAIDNGDGSLSIPRQALRDAVFATSGYQGVTGTITCLPTGDCATDVKIGLFLAPGWPVEGGTDDHRGVHRHEVAGRRAVATEGRTAEGPWATPRGSPAAPSFEGGDGGGHRGAARGSRTAKSLRAASLAAHHPRHPRDRRRRRRGHRRDAHARPRSGRRRILGRRMARLHRPGRLAGRDLRDDRSRLQLGLRDPPHDQLRPRRGVHGRRLRVVLLRGRLRRRAVSWTGTPSSRSRS